MTRLHHHPRRQHHPGCSGSVHLCYGQLLQRCRTGCRLKLCCPRRSRLSVEQRYSTSTSLPDWLWLPSRWLCHRHLEPDPVVHRCCQQGILCRRRWCPRPLRSRRRSLSAPLRRVNDRRDESTYIQTGVPDPTTTRQHLAIPPHQRRHLFAWFLTIIFADS